MYVLTVAWTENLDIAEGRLALLAYPPPKNLILSQEQSGKLLTAT